MAVNDKLQIATRLGNADLATPCRTIGIDSPFYRPLSPVSRAAILCRITVKKFVFRLVRRMWCPNVIMSTSCN